MCLRKLPDTTVSGRSTMFGFLSEFILIKKFLLPSQNMVRADLFSGSLAVCLSAPVQGEAGGRGVWGNSARRAQSVPFVYFSTFSHVLLRHSSLSLRKHGCVSNTKLLINSSELLRFSFVRIQIFNHCFFYGFSMR